MSLNDSRPIAPCAMIFGGDLFTSSSLHPLLPLRRYTAGHAFEVCLHCCAFSSRQHTPQICTPPNTHAWTHAMHTYTCSLSLSPRRATVVHIRAYPLQPVPNDGSISVFPSPAQQPTTRGAALERWHESTAANVHRIAITAPSKLEVGLPCPRAKHIFCQDSAVPLMPHWGFG